MKTYIINDSEVFRLSVAIQSSYTINDSDAGRYLGAEITEQTSTGVPSVGQKIIINNIGSNSDDDNIPDTPIVGGTTGVMIVDQTEPDTNLIGSSTNLQVGHTYQFKIWYDTNKNGVKDPGELDASNNYTYKWVFNGESATAKVPGGDAVSSTDNKDITIPKLNSDAVNVFESAGVDGVQGYSLEVDYNAIVSKVNNRKRVKKEILKTELKHKLITKISSKK